MPTAQWTSRITREWPSSSSFLCWHCAHPFHTVPVYLPITRDVSQNLFVFHGNYCSWNCVKAYAWSLHKLKPVAAQYIALLAFLTSYRPAHCPVPAAAPHPYDCPCLLSYQGLTQAEPKEVLLAFGGHQTIQQYRANFMVVHDVEAIKRYFHLNNEVPRELCRLQQRPYLYAFLDKKDSCAMGTKHVVKQKEERKEPKVHVSWEIVQLLSYKG